MGSEKSIIIIEIYDRFHRNYQYCSKYHPFRSIRERNMIDGTMTRASAIITLTI